MSLRSVTVFCIARAICSALLWLNYLSNTISLLRIRESEIAGTSQTLVNERATDPLTYVTHREHGPSNENVSLS